MTQRTQAGNAACEPQPVRMAIPSGARRMHTIGTQTTRAVLAASRLAWPERVCPRRSRRDTLAFTLIELLVVTAILGLLIAVIAACLNGGLKVWDEAKSFHTSEADAQIGLELLNKDLVNTFLFADIPFDGTEHRLSFPGFSGVGDATGVASGVTQKDPSEWRIGFVNYVFNASRRELRRETGDYKTGTTDAENMRTERVMTDVVEVSFRYRKGLQGSGAGAWQTEWHSRTNLPLAVGITVKGGEGTRRFVLLRTVVIPVAVPAVAREGADRSSGGFGR